MKSPNCAYEEKVMKAIRSEVWDAATKQHFDSCTPCQTAARVRTFVRSIAKKTRSQASPPAYGLIWFKAHFQAKQRRAYKALKPLLLFLAAIEIVLGLSLLWWWRSATIHGSLGELWISLQTGSDAPIVADIMPAAVLALSMILIAAIYFGASNAFIYEKE